MKVKVMIVMVLALALSLGCLSKGIAEVLRITDNTYEDSNPQTSNGCVVWQGTIDGNTEIFFYNANDGTGPVRITENTYGDAKPHTDCQYITWAAGSAQNGEIYLYEIATGTTTQITSDTAIDFNPKVGNGWVVWESSSVSEFVEPGEILAYDIDNAVITNVSEMVDPLNEFDDRSLRIDGNLVFWVQEGNGEIFDFVHVLATGSTEINYSLKPPNQQVDGDLMSLFRTVDGDDDNEIFLHHKTGTTRITDNDIDDRDPSLADGFLAWVGGTGSGREIYLSVLSYLALVSPSDGFVSYTNTKEYPEFSWDSIGYTPFKIQFSSQPDFSSKMTLTFPSSDSDWLTLTAFTPGKNELNKVRHDLEPIYWRVLAQDQYGHVEISQTRSLSFAEPEGNQGVQ